MEGLVGMVLSACLFFCGIFVGMLPSEKGQDVIDHFEKAPVCVEQKVGKDLIKKCYKLEEVK